jgi:hypothetical protein
MLECMAYTGNMNVTANTSGLFVCALIDESFCMKTRYTPRRQQAYFKWLMSFPSQYS